MAAEPGATVNWAYVSLVALRCFWCNKANWMLIPSQMTRRTIFAALFSAHNHLQSVSNQLQVPQKEGLSPLANLEHQK